MEKVRIGIVGMGRMGITHFSIINSHPKVEVVSVSDTSKMILDYLAKYIDGIKVYNDFEKQLESDHLDGIIVSTPSSLHYRICKKALEKNISVFCEKPFTTNPTQAKELAEEFAKAGLVNQVGYTNRCWESFNKMKEILDSGLLGKILHFNAEMFSSTIIKPQTEDSWRSKRENGGGATYEMGSHVIDLIHYLIGVPDRIAGSSLSQIYSKTVEDIVTTTMLYEDGKVGQFYVNWSEHSYRKPMIKLELFCEKGKIMADHYAIKFFLFENQKDYAKGWHFLNFTDLYRPVPFYVRGGGFTTQLYRFADKLLDNNVECPCTFEDGAKAQVTIHKIFEDANK